MDTRDRPEDDGGSVMINPDVRHINSLTSAHSSESWNLVKSEETGSQIKFGMSGVAWSFVQDLKGSCNED